MLAKEASSISSASDDILTALSKFTDEEINECIDSEFVNDSVLSGLDVKGLYILLSNLKEVASGIETTSFDMDSL